MHLQLIIPISFRRKNTIMEKWLGDLLIDGVGSSLCSSVLGQEINASEFFGERV